MLRSPFYSVAAALMFPPFRGWIMELGLGGTANSAVLGGNLPPSLFKVGFPLTGWGGSLRDRLPN